MAPVVNILSLDEMLINQKMLDARKDFIISHTLKYCLKKNITLFEKYFALNKFYKNTIQVEVYLIFWFFKPKFFYRTLFD